MGSMVPDHQVVNEFMYVTTRWSMSLCMWPPGGQWVYGCPTSDVGNNFIVHDHQVVIEFIDVEHQMFKFIKLQLIGWVALTKYPDHQVVNEL